MSETMTEKQRVAVEALEAARRAGVPLSAYAKARGLELRPVYLTRDEFEDLLAFVRDGLADPRVSKKNLCRLIPATLPSGRTPLNFTECPESSDSD